MGKIFVEKENYDKFIFKGSLALECYNDFNDGFEDLFKNFNKKLKDYRNSPEKTDESKEEIVNELISVMEKMGIDNFNIYDDGGVEYEYKPKKGVDHNVI